MISAREINSQILKVDFETEKVDLSLGRDLKHEFLSALEGDYPFIIVDLKKVKFMDSSGLGILVMAWQAVSKRKGKIVCIEPSDSMKKLFAISKIEQFIKLYDTLDDAIKTFS